MAMTSAEISAAIAEGKAAVDDNDWSTIKSGIASSTKGADVRKHIYAEAHAASLVVEEATEAMADYPQLKADIEDFITGERTITKGTEDGAFNGTEIVGKGTYTHIHLTSPLQYTSLSFTILSANFGTVFCLPNDGTSYDVFGNTVGNWEISLERYKEVYINFFGSEFAKEFYAESVRAVSQEFEERAEKEFDAVDSIRFDIDGCLKLQPKLSPGYIESSTGLVHIDSTAIEDWKHTDYIQIPEGCKTIVHNFEIIGTIACSWAVYDSEKSFITSGVTSTVNPSSDYAYIRFCNYDTSKEHSNKYLKFGTTSKKISADINPVYNDSTNGKFIGSDNTWYNLPACPNFNYSEPIHIKSGTKIHVDATECGKLNSVLSVCAFFSSGESVESQTPYGAVGYNVSQNTYIITVPDGYEYVVFSRNVQDSGALLVQPKITFDDNYFVNQIAKIAESSGASIYAKLHIADVYTLVVGDLFELFWKGVIEAYDPYIYSVEVACTVGSCYKRKFEYTPNSVGEYSMTITLKANDGTVLDSKTTTLKCVAQAASPSTAKTVLCVGDSLLAYGNWAIESNRRFTGTDGDPAGLGLSNINYIGTCERNGTHYEGWSGYAFKNFNTQFTTASVVWITCAGHTKSSLDQHAWYKDSNGVLWKIETIETDRLKMIRSFEYTTVMPSSGTLTWYSGGSDTSNIVYTSVENTASNPFWDEDENKVDFKTYADRLGVSNIDYCYVMLGANSTEENPETYKADVKTFIDNLLASFPECKIGLMSTIVPCFDGCGQNYGCSWPWLKKAKILWNMFDMYGDVSDEYDNVHYINVCGQFDVENNMVTSQRKVNARNSTMETYQSNGMHPALSGEYQIADVVYRDLSRMLQM